MTDSAGVKAAKITLANREADLEVLDLKAAKIIVKKRRLVTLINAHVATLNALDVKLEAVNAERLRVLHLITFNTAIINKEAQP
jgi:hypothetical protein